MEDKLKPQMFPVLSMIAGLVMLSQPVLAHHGTFISYDAVNTFTLKGVVTEFRYANPHPQIFFEVKDDKGKVVLWSTEIPTNVGQMQRSGWTKQRSTEALKPGTVVTVLVQPAKAGGPFGLASKIQNEKGEVLLRNVDGGQ